MGRMAKNPANRPDAQRQGKGWKIANKPQGSTVQ
jgi:hypothetical protein